MSLLPTHRPRRNRLLPLLLAIGPLAGCRSERAAFRFQPEAQRTVRDELITQPQRGESMTAPLAATTPLHPTQPSRLKRVAPTRQLPRPAHYQRQLLGGAGLCSRAHRGNITGTDSEAGKGVTGILRAQASASPQRFKPTDVAFYLGIFCMVAGVVCLVAAISPLSGGLALAGLALAITGIALFYHGVWNHGHWSFG